MNTLLNDSPRPARGARPGDLKKLTGSRAGAVYSVTRSGGVAACTCPDHQKNKFSCKHIKALVVLGVISGRTRPAPALAIEAPRSPAARATAAAIVARAAQLGTAAARREGGAL